MPSVRFEDVVGEDELKEYKFKTDPTYFEKYCGACIHFDKKKCPFYGKVIAENEWDYYTHIVQGIGKKCDLYFD